MFKWPVLVVSMVGAAERRSHMRETFKSESLRFIPGYDPSGLTHADFLEQNILHRDAKENIPSIGEIGCALGHAKAWQWAVNNLGRDQYAVILEDDVEPTEYYTKNIQRSVQLQGGLSREAAVTFLCHDGGWGCNSKTRHYDGRLISGKGKPASGNYGYVINKLGAEQALDLQFPMHSACDVQWRGLDNMYLIEKPIVKQGSIGRFSQIRGRKWQ